MTRPTGIIPEYATDSKTWRITTSPAYRRGIVVDGFHFWNFQDNETGVDNKGAEK